MFFETVGTEFKFCRNKFIVIFKNIPCCKKILLGIRNNCIMSIEGTRWAISSPGRGLQRVVYSAHNKRRCLLFLSLMSPDGMNVIMYGTIEGRHHDMYAYSESGAEEFLKVFLVIGGRQYMACRDNVFNKLGYFGRAARFSTRTENEAIRDSEICKVRSSVENVFALQYEKFERLGAARSL